jgi:hypothetical protein
MPANINIDDEQQVDEEIAVQNSKSVTGVGEGGVRIEQRMLLEEEIEQDISQPSVVSQRCRVKDETWWS